MEKVKRIGNVYNVKKNSKGGRCYNPSGLCPVISTMSGGGNEPIVMSEYRIRKITPREAWRLMDYADEDFEKAEAVNSNSQLYTQAGNGIVVSCLSTSLLPSLSTKPSKESEPPTYLSGYSSTYRISPT